MMNDDLSYYYFIKNSCFKFNLSQNGLFILINFLGLQKMNDLIAIKFSN